MSSPLLTLLLIAASSALFQAASNSPDLASLIRDLPAKAADGTDPTPVVQPAEKLGAAPLQEVEANLPVLIALTETSDDRTRSFAVFSLMGMEGMSGNPPNRMDKEKIKLLLPYTSRLAPRLFDPATAAAAILILNPMAGMRPLSP